MKSSLAWLASDRIWSAAAADAPLGMEMLFMS